MDGNAPCSLMQAPTLELLELKEVLDDFDIDQYRVALERIPGPSAPGAPSFSRLAILRSFVVWHVLGYNSISDLIRELRINPYLAEIVGFLPKWADEQADEIASGNERRRRTSAVAIEDGRPVRRCKGIPSRSVFSRTFAILRQDPGLIAHIIIKCTDRLHELLPDLGDEVAADSTTVLTFCNPNRGTKQDKDRVSDTEAGFTKKHSARGFGGTKGSGSKPQQSDTVWVYGYKVHLVVCVKYGMVLGIIITPANVNDSPLLPQLYEQCVKNFRWFGPSIFIADRGYDSANNNLYLYERNVAAVIHKRTSAQERKGGIYNAKGVPRCVGSVEMEFVRTDEETGHHLYRCPTTGCHLRDKVQWSRHCDYESWEDPTLDLRLFGGMIRRASAEWDAEYKKRWEEERTNGQLKANRTLEGHYFRGLPSVTVHSLLAVAARQHLALVRVRAGEVEKMRQRLVHVK